MSGGASMESIARMLPKANVQHVKERCGHFQMPLHYPRYNKMDYETMPEWKLDRLLSEYGLPVTGDVAYKRSFAMGAFLWPTH